MKRLYLLCLLLVLAACGQSGEVTQIATTESLEPTSPPAAPTEVVPTASEAPTTAIATSEVAGEALATPIAQVTTSLSEAGEIRDRDWVKGATEPSITFIEYGDFQ